MPEPVRTEIVVLGAGPGGYAAAFHAADRGKKVVLVEMDKRLGGVCLNAGCIPSKALLHAAAVMREAEESKKRGIAFGPPVLELEKLRGWKESVLEKLGQGKGGVPGLVGLGVQGCTKIGKDGRKVRPGFAPRETPPPLPTALKPVPRTRPHIRRTPPPPASPWG